MSSFAVTWDYRCPFARIAHDHVVTALQDGADWDVTFVPFSLNQAHVEDGGTAVWDDPAQARNLLAMQVGIVMRDVQRDRFLEVHRALFDHKHVHGRDLRDEAQLRRLLEGLGVDADEVFGEIATGWPLKTFRAEHEAAAGEAEVWGVPTFVVDDAAAFVRLMKGPDGDATLARRTVERVLDMLAGWPELNEFKHTSLDH